MAVLHGSYGLGLRTSSQLFSKDRGDDSWSDYILSRVIPRIPRKINYGLRCLISDQATPAIWFIAKQSNNACPVYSA